MEQNRVLEVGQYLYVICYTIMQAPKICEKKWKMAYLEDAFEKLSLHRERQNEKKRFISNGLKTWIWKFKT